MAVLTVRHRTEYWYRQPVRLGPHRLMLRPREGMDLQVRSSVLSIAPEASITWAQDVWGNAIATATFGPMADRLVIDCIIEVDLRAAEWPVFAIDVSAQTSPFRYSDDEWKDLGAVSRPVYDDPDRRMADWAERVAGTQPMDTLTLLRRISETVNESFRYESREAEGTQTPAESLDRGVGSCRDFAVLFAEAVRHLGFGARMVSGYLVDRGDGTVGLQGTGSTHAWAEVYLPGAGWIAFDPTNRTMGAGNLIPVAVARDIARIVPVTGTFAGAPDAIERMDVQVSVASV